MIVARPERPVRKAIPGIDGHGKRLPQFHTGDVGLTYGEPDLLTAGGFDADQRSARGRQIANLHESVHDAAVKGSANHRLAGHRGCSLDGSLCLLDCSLGRIELHPSHVELEVGGGALSVQDLETVVVPLGQRERRLGL